MNTIFYLYGFIFLFRSIRGIYNSRKKSYENIELLSNVDLSNPYSSMDYLNGKIKEKPVLGRIFQNTDFIWNMAGVFLSPTYILFVALLVSDVVSRILFITCKSQNQLRHQIVFGNIIDIVICCAILYKNLYQIQ